jgi:hypothetical protein
LTIGVVYELPLNGIDTVLILGAALPALILAFRVKLKPYRTFAILLAGFLAVHGIYHLLEFLELSFGVSMFGLIGDILVEPTSYVILASFVIYYYRRG